MKKKEVIQHWQGLKPMPLEPKIVRYKHEGSTYDQDGIRITGSRAWIDSVLSRLKDLLRCENGETRLQLAYQEATDIKTGEPLGTYSCYIQIHERGPEAKMANFLASAYAGKETVLSRGY